MNWSVKINGKYFNNSNVSEIKDQEICDFLMEWGNTENFVLVHTSGSTGKPKSIQLLKTDMVASAKLTGQYFRLQKNQKALLCLPVKYIAGKMILIRAIVLELDLISISPSRNPMQEIDAKIDFAAMTPMQVKTVLKQSPDKLSLIKNLIIGGGPVDAILEDELQTIKTACYSTYGMTETITHIAVRKLNGKDKSDLFEALPNVTLSVNKDNCLVIKAPHLTTSTIVTTDITRITDYKHFKWKGRSNNTINTGGVKIQPEAIESKISNLLKNNRFFISSLPDKLLGERVVLVIESSEKLPYILTKIKEILPSFERPKNVFFIPNFIETNTGKIHRKKTQEKVFTNFSKVL